LSAQSYPSFHWPKDLYAAYLIVDQTITYSLDDVRWKYTSGNTRRSSETRAGSEIGDTFRIYVPFGKLSAPVTLNCLEFGAKVGMITQS
jgi:hypothetical protein